MPVDYSIPMSAGPAGAARIDPNTPRQIDSQTPMAVQPFKPIDVTQDTSNAYKLADTIGQFQEDQSKRLDSQRIREEKQRDQMILQQYQQAGGDLYSAEGLELAAKDLQGKLSADSFQGLSKKTDEKKLFQQKFKEASMKLSDSEFDLMAKETEQSTRMLSRALSAYDSTLETTGDKDKANEAYTTTKQALIQNAKQMVSNATGKPLYNQNELDQFAAMDPEQLRGVVEETTWHSKLAKQEALNRLHDSQSDKADALAKKYEQDVLNMKEKLKGGISSLGPEELNTMAEFVRTKGPGVLGRFGLNPADRQAVMKTVTAINGAEGVSARDAAVELFNIEANRKSLDKMVPQYDAITAFEKTMENIGGKLTSIAKKVDSTGVPVAERWIRAGKRAVEGDADVTEFNARMQTFRTEAARVINNPNLTGVLSDSARHEIEDIIPNSSSYDQIERGVQTLISEGQTRRKYLDDQIGTAKARISKGAGKPANVSTPSLQVPKNEQAERDVKRKEVLEDELTLEEVKFNDESSTPEMKHRAQQNMESLKRELAGLGGAKVPKNSAVKPTISNW